MPVDFEARSDPKDVASNLEQTTWIQQEEDYSAMMDQLLEKDLLSPIRLGEIPTERTVGELYGHTMEVVRESSFDVARSVDGFQPLAILAGEPCFASIVEKPESSTSARQNTESTRGVGASATAVQTTSKMDTSLEADTSYHVWDLLEALPLPSPVYGALSTKGKGFLHKTVMVDLYASFPRLRAVHAREILATTTGLYPLVDVAERLGISKFVGLEHDVNLWKERNTVYQRQTEIFKRLADDRRKTEQGRSETGERLYHTEDQAKKITKILKLLPADIDELLPRVTWVGNHVHAFLGFYSMVKGEAAAQTLIRRLFTPGFNHDSPGDHGQHHLWKFHDRRRKWFKNYGFHVTGEAPIDDHIKTHEIPRKYLHPDLAKAVDAWYSSPDTTPPENTTQQKEEAKAMYTVPSLVTLSVQPLNAVKELQIVLKYSHDVPKQLQGKGHLLDFEKEYTDMDHQETQVEADLAEQERPTWEGKRKVVGKLLAPGNIVLGRGIGDDLAQAMNNAAKHALMNYYFKRNIVLAAAEDAPATPPANTDSKIPTEATSKTDSKVDFRTEEANRAAEAEWEAAQRK